MHRWRPVYGEIEFECGHWPVFENAIDMAHIHYLHADSFGNKVLIPACPALGAAEH
jgi:Vanillate O-demethylase oxygenase C-terminal domain